ncbi:PREDICTED: PHD and RING finger domain-containing protein 1 [Elephantulus edwardii]|uniref:PHD and RING finger domain-containing protein 1 n=1 Tax=Elephantulus edwardii TaxID=28737 RepID=UPI0003F0E286|nr:PREDICTED: PHD and RING finger domain-containing protein 1 [Elephantulus edwardii]
MDEDSLDELTERTAQPGGHLWPSPAGPASDAEERSDGNSGDTGDDTSSEHGDSTEDNEDEMSEDEDQGDRSGTEDSEDEVVVLSANTQKQQPPVGRVLSSDDEAESCPICLNVFRDQAVGTPETCAHYFCLDCILEWSKNATSCPVDRTVFKCICVRARLGGKILRKIPVENTQAPEAEEDDPTFCEVCGHSDREDRLLLCDRCDAGYHMECLDPPLQEVPVDEWFCPECAAPGTGSGEASNHISEEEVSLLLADVVPTSSRLRPSTVRTRAIARTRQSERVRATVNRNRITTARRIQHVPRYLMSSLLDETIEAVASGLSTAVYQRPLSPRAPVRRKRKTGRRKKVSGRRKGPSKSSVRSKSSGARSRRRQARVKKRKGLKLKVRVTARVRIARTLGLQRPVLGTSFPSVYRPAEPSLGLMRADIGAASLSLFGDPHELDPFDSEEIPTQPASPLSAKRRALSQSALRSHQPVARPVSVALSRRGVPAAAAAPEPQVEASPVPDLLGSILCSQSFLMMGSSDIVIHRDGSLSAKRAAPVALQRSSLSTSSGTGASGAADPQPSVLPSGTPVGALTRSGPEGSILPSHSGPVLAPAPAPRAPAQPARPPVRLRPSALPSATVVQTQSLVSSTSGSSHGVPPQFNGDGKHAVSPGSTSPTITSRNSHSSARPTAVGCPLRPAPRRRDISELPRIPKIKRDDSSGQVDSTPSRGQGQSVGFPSSCISHLTGREGPAQPGRGVRAEGQPRSQGLQEPGAPQPTAPSSHSCLTPVGAMRGKGMGSTFESFRINIPGNTAHSSRLPGPGFCNTFRPVDNKVQRKENPAPLFSLKKPKQLKSEIYDPFEPTGSDSSSPGSSPERLGSGLLPSEITRTISIHSPKAPACQTVRCVTSYTVRGAFGEPEPARGTPSSARRLCRGAGAEGPEAARLGEDEDVEDAPRRSAFFDSEARTVTCVVEPEAPDSPDPPAATTHRIVELRSPSPPDSESSACGPKGAQRGQEATKERRRTRSRSRSASRSRERSSRSASPEASEPPTRKHRPKARARRSSSEGSSSRDRVRRKKAKARERKRGSGGRARRRSRSPSEGSSAHEHHEGRKKRARRSKSRSRGREGSPPSSLERPRRHKRRRERSRDRKDGASRPRGRRRSRERSKWRARSSSTEHRFREQRRPRSRDRQPQTRSPDRKLPAKEASPPPAHDVPGQDRDPNTGPSASAQPLVTATPLPPVPAVEEGEAPSEAPAASEAPVEMVPDDMDYVDSVEAGHVFDDFSNDTAFFQLDDMSSPPSPESTSDSSPERALPSPAPPGPPHNVDLDTSRALAVIQREVSLIHGDDDPQTPSLTEGAPDRVSLGQDGIGDCGTVGMVSTVKEVGSRVGEGPKLEEAAPQTSLLRSKAPVKRVTWNLLEEGASEGRAEHLLPSSQALPEPVFPEVDPAQVYSPALPSSGPPHAPVSQPGVQIFLPSSLPLAGCGGVHAQASVPTTLTTVSEPVPVPTTNDVEEKAAPKPTVEKAKNEEYMKKLHMQERAVEEVKLAIKPFYQKREITKEEYKDILRKAVQKICHSKSGEINPMKVANLVKAYVEKYRHMRKHKKAEPEEGPPAQEVES